MKVICPLYKNELPKCCENCKFVVKQNEQIIGCAVKHIARNLFNNKQASENITQEFIKFKKDMTNGN
jgi:hypothetical protein